MNRASQLFDESYVRNLFREEILPKYSDFVDVGKIVIKPFKKMIWETTYHVVVEYKTIFISKEKKKSQVSIICSAHSEEPRINFYEGMRFLWQQGFGNGYISIPRPLFFSEYFNGLFYRAAKGNNLYSYIKAKDYKEIESIIPKAALWFAKLHRLPVVGVKNFNADNSLIETVLPGINHILHRVKNDYPDLSEIFSVLYNEINNKEKDFLGNSEKRWLIHGDAHPENIIRMSKRKIAIIDFSDLCIADFARDLGCFIQQLGYMSKRKIGNPKYTKKIQKLFLDSYFKERKIKLDDELQARIDNYYNWTTMRTATHFLIKHGPEPARALPLIKEVADRLKINF